MKRIEKIFKEFTVYLDNEDLANSTVIRYINCINSYINFLKAHEYKTNYINQISHQSLIEYTSYMFNSKKATSTVRINLYSIKIFTEYAIDMGYINQGSLNISKDFINHLVSSRQVSRTKRNPVTKIEFKQIISQEENTLINTILHFLYSYGFRISDLLNLTWQDINCNRKTLYISNTKGNDSKTYTLSDKEISLLHSLPQVSKWVFASQKKKGVHISRTTVSKKFKDRCKSLKLSDNICLHSLRHSFVTNSLKDNSSSAL